jgi:hypothetical protein
VGWIGLGIKLIRNYELDGLSKSQNENNLDLVSPLIIPSKQDNTLEFYTSHPTDAYKVDLRVFAHGENGLRNGKSKKSIKTFSGRPNLIYQLLPAIMALSEFSRKETVTNYVKSLRRWWNLFDEVEESAVLSGHEIERVEDVRQLTEMHSRWAHDHGMRQVEFSTFVFSIVNPTLLALGERKLHWVRPTDKVSDRRLPSPSHIVRIRHILKDAWWKTVKKWEHIDALKSGIYPPVSDEDHRILSFIDLSEQLERHYGKVLADKDEIEKFLSINRTNAVESGIILADIRSTIFPNAWDAYSAFHLCLAVTGWNATTLFSLNVNSDFLRTHPKDTGRFILEPPNELENETYELKGIKTRGGSEQIHTGLKKSQFSAWKVINLLLNRNQPLREQIKLELKSAKEEYVQKQHSGANISDLDNLFKYISELEVNVKSPWIYASSKGNLLSGKPNSISRVKSSLRLSINGNDVSYLHNLISTANLKLENEKQISMITAGDLRDIYSYWVWQNSGGNILALMKALGHRRLSTTIEYSNNNLINEEIDNTYVKFTNTFWSGLDRGKLDIPILITLLQQGKVTEEETNRLEEYRKLRKSRLGIGCKDPLNPPKHLAVGFKADGQRLCNTQRCLLCPIHAVLLPESVDGISMRAEELVEIKKNISLEAWTEGQYPAEMENILSALMLYPEEKVNELRVYWEELIRTKKHIVPGL